MDLWVCIEYNSHIIPVNAHDLVRVMFCILVHRDLFLIKGERSKLSNTLLIDTMGNLQDQHFIILE